MPEKKLQIRNSTAEFLIFSSQAGEESIEVRIADENVWLTQKLIAKLFEVEINTINYHLKEIYKSGENSEDSTIRKFRIVQKEGSRNVERDIDFYNLEMIISVGYRVNSERAVQFRQWATGILEDFGKVSAEVARSFAESEFDKYKIIQDRYYVSDFDKMVRDTIAKYEGRK